MGERHIVIVGAGIGGLAAALGLSRAGFRITIIERALALSEIGAGIQLSPNAMRALAALGVGDAVAARAIQPDAIVVRNGISGRRLVTLAGEAFRRRTGEPYRVIHRSGLQAALVDAVRSAGVDMRLSATVTDTHTLGDRVEVGIASGGARDTVSATALIGADGVRSAIRAMVAGSATVAPANRTAWRAIVPASAENATSVGLWLGPHAHLVHYPMGGGMMNVVAIVDDPWRGGEWNEPGDGTALARLFAAWAGPARVIIAAAKELRTFALATVDPSARWAEGRTALLGDAAHAMQPYLAQGAAMALEDAVVLALHLDGATDIPAALHAYEAERKPRVSRVAAASARTGGWYHASPPLSFARDAGLIAGGEALLFAMNDWIYRWEAPRPSASNSA